MNSLRYLNTILTVLALLLALNLWTAWTAAPEMAPAAHAAGIPDAGAQRQQMIDLLKKLNLQSEELGTLLQSGRVRVTVIMPDQ